MNKPMSAGFAIGVYDDSLIADNARDRFSPKYGDADARQHAMQAGLVDAEGEITKKGWDLLNKDAAKLERNSLKWLRANFRDARDEGHDKYGDLIGTVWFDTEKQAELIELGTDERIDMADPSYGNLSRTVWDGVSDFGANVLGGAINFYDVDSGE